MSEQQRLLFVDDEPNILKAMQRALRGMRKEWDMVFVADAGEALEVMQRDHFDVVISDMMMPQMDGAELLSRIKEHDPGTVRFILSGHTEIGLVLKSLGCSHQYLSKPCDPVILRRTIERAHAMRDLLRNDRIASLLSGVDRLPSLPSLFQKLIEELGKPNASLERIGELIAQDIGMSVKILQIVNSSYFGLRQRIASVERAVTYLGLDTINSLVLGAGVFLEYEDVNVPGLSLERLWDSANRSALIARMIARMERVETNQLDESLIAGMLHDVGRIVLAVNQPEEYSRALELRRQRGCSLAEAELEVLGATHGEIGGYLTGIWGLPDTIVESIARHDRPPCLEEPEFDSVAVAHVAAALAEEQVSGEHDHALDPSYLEALGVVDKLDDWRDAIMESSQS